MSRIRLLGALGAAVAAMVISESAARGVSEASRTDTVRAFVQRYEQAVNARDVAAINACLNERAMVARARRGVNIAAPHWKGFAAGVCQGFDWGEALAVGLGETGHYRLLELHAEAEPPRALLRMVNAIGGLNYHDVLLAEKADGGVEIVDVHVFLSGEALSDSVRRSLLQFMAARRGGDQEYMRSLNLLGAMGDRVRGGAHAEALGVYDRMPESLQRDRNVQLMRVTSAAQIDEQTIARAIKDFRRFYPDDPSLDLLMVDQLILRGQWREAIAAFERIRKAVGDDAYLDVLIASVHLAGEALPEARAAARRSVRKEPTLEDGHWTLLEVALRQQDHPETARILTVLENQFAWQFDELASVPAYASFLKSPAYAEWAASRRVTQAE